MQPALETGLEVGICGVRGERTFLQALLVRPGIHSAIFFQLSCSPCFTTASLSSWSGQGHETGTGWKRGTYLRVLSTADRCFSPSWVWMNYKIMTEPNCNCPAPAPQCCHISQPRDTESLSRHSGRPCPSPSTIPPTMRSSPHPSPKTPLELHHSLETKGLALRSPQKTSPRKQMLHPTY